MEFTSVVSLHLQRVRRETGIECDGDDTARAVCAAICMVSIGLVDEPITMRIGNQVIEERAAELCDHLRLNSLLADRRARGLYPYDAATRAELLRTASKHDRSRLTDATQPEPRRIVLADFADAETMRQLYLPRAIIERTTAEDPVAVMQCGHLSDYYDEDTRAPLCARCLVTNAGARAVSA